MKRLIQKLAGSDFDGMSVPDWDDDIPIADDEPEDADADHGDDE